MENNIVTIVGFVVISTVLTLGSCQMHHQVNDALKLCLDESYDRFHKSESKDDI